VFDWGFETKNEIEIVSEAGVETVNEFAIVLFVSVWNWNEESMLFLWRVAPGND